MEQNCLREILLTKAAYGSVTDYSSLSEETQRQLVVTAVLELYKAEALGGGSNSWGINSNMQNLEEHVEQIMKALTPN
ncbi:hypothetical protein [Shewanella atlantica]|uniref:hypothetical protein n=1 Tax=Shewanella atlantica TaxID=271099 RepID=UPI003734E02F